MNRPSESSEEGADALAVRCARAGLMPSYVDVHGVEHTVAPANLVAILDALRQDADEAGNTLLAPARAAVVPVAVSATREASEPASGEPATRDAVACHLPPALLRGERIWGLAVQLYGLRSKRNWGIGDFGDLAHLVSQWAERGADLIGLNPLHALSPTRMSCISPYSPSSRLHLNWLCLDVEQVVGFDACEPVQRRVASSAFRAELQRVRQADTVDYVGAAGLKREVLQLLYANFRGQAADSSASLAFDSFRRDRGASLRRHAAFEALQVEFAAARPEAASWRDWPETFRSPDSDAVARFIAEHPVEIGYTEFLEWQASVQLAGVQARCRECGMAVGLYLDMAVSVDPDGSDVWAHQAVYAAGVQIGAPPDEGNPAGQDWGLSPLRPDALKQSNYDLLRRTLVASMQFGGALRIDHVMGLMRLYLVPRNASPRDGAYLLYPYRDLLGIVAAESQRHRCMVIGEDLGTVDPAMQHAMREHRVLSYKVLYFEQSKDEGFRPADAYPSLALATVSTHDLPTLAGWWSERDLDLRETLGLYPDALIGALQRNERRHDRRRLLNALVHAKLLPDGTDLQALADAPLPEWLAHEIQAFVASTAAQVVMMQIEDAHGVAEQANLPGTIHEHPNWRRKLPAEIDGDDATGASLRASVQALADKIDQARRRPG